MALYLQDHAAGGSGEYLQASTRAVLSFPESFAAISTMHHMLAFRSMQILWGPVIQRLLACSICHDNYAVACRAAFISSI